MNAIHEMSGLPSVTECDGEILRNKGTIDVPGRYVHSAITECYRERLRSTSCTGSKNGSNGPRVAAEMAADFRLLY